MPAWELLTYECAGCGLHVDAPSPLDPLCQILYTRGQACPAHACVGDDHGVMGEVPALLEQLPEWRAIPPGERQRFLQRLSECAYDLGPDGTPFESDVNPPCPRCGSRVMADFVGHEPPRLARVDIPRATYDQWRDMPRDERREMLRRRLRELQEAGAPPPRFTRSAEYAAALRASVFGGDALRWHQRMRASFVSWWRRR